MMKFRTVKIDRVFLNKANGQLTVCIPKKKMKGLEDGRIPKRLQLRYW